ncbi:SEN1 N terminal-domain-containing protein [Amylocystis lapponica]|nr:SEN1 N terminal-domain-containing protein [Amylocystis lapponica]
MAPLQPVNNDEVNARLAKLRDEPEATPSEEVLLLLTRYLVGPSSDNTNNAGRPSRHREHWFCSRADKTTVGVATFLIRLHAYNSARVDKWRQQFRECLASCCDCIRSLQEVKVTSRHTYFGAFSDETLKSFYDNFNEWELQSVLLALSNVKILPDSAPTDERTLSDAPPAVVYHILSNLHILQDPRILKIIHSSPPGALISRWPTDIPPAGLFFLLLDARLESRNWARQQLASYKSTPLSKDHFLSTYITVLQTVTKLVMPESSVNPGVVDILARFTFVQDVATLWSGYCAMLRFVPVEFLRTGKSIGIDLRHVVIGHLHDTGTHFIDVLKGFVLIMSRIGSAIWEGEGLEFPQVIFMSIKDNTRYLVELNALQASRKDNWLLNWVETYIKTVATSPAFKDIFPTVVHFLCEELQHERFQVVRPAAMTIASRLVLAVIQAAKDSSSSQPAVAWEIIDVHASVFVSVAFTQQYADEKWTEARTSARKLVKQSLIKDAKDVSTVISQLCGVTPKSGPISPIRVREQIWKQMYDNIQPSDSDGIAMIVSTLTAIAHIDAFKEAAFVDKIRASQNSDAFRAVLKSLNHALTVVSSGFGEVVTRYLDFSLPSVVVDLLRRPEIVKNVTILMFSPIEVLQETAQALAGAAFDVDVRLDCFRALLEKFPDSTFSGIFTLLETFHQYAQGVPEACSLSKALARCLTDIIDVLCSSPDGLLLNEQFLKAEGRESLSVQLPKWWNLMTQALSVIFLRTPRWAVYFENAEMVLWMRDALIFGRDMLAQRRVIETGALAQSQQGKEVAKRKLSRTGKTMVDNLQPVLLELARWLRLTDEELLHQSFALLESLLACFQETGVPPSPDALQKLQKHIDGARNKDPSRPQTRLDSTRIARLQDAVSAFDEDDIQIISHKLPEPKGKAVAQQSKAMGSKGKAGPEASTSQKAKFPIDRRAPVKTSVSSYFTAEDQKKLDTESSLSQMKRPVKPSNEMRPVEKQNKDDASAKGSTAAASSSSEEGSDDEGNAGLASLSKLQRTPKIKRPVERRQVMMLDMPTTMKNPALERIRKREEARRAQLRLKPDLSDLHRSILSWDYNHSGPDPPGERLNFIHVPDKFTDPQHFRRVFEPLLLSECWTQLIESKEENRDAYECRIGSRQFSDAWLDLDISVGESVKRDFMLTDSDVVLLRHPGNRRSVLGKVQFFRATPVGITAVIRCIARGSDSGLQIGAVWLISKALSLATLHREYAALMALPYYDLCDTIMQARLMKSTSTDSQEVQRTMATYNVNEPQARAMLNALQVEGFSLIQGPPGTGKTSTICGLVHAFLSRRPKPATAVYAGRSTGPADKEPAKKVLLCAPSNAAIDEIAYRLKEGVSGAGRRNMCPKVVRVGAVNSMNINVRDISLEQLIDQKLNTDPELQHSSKDSGSDIARLRAELESVKRIRQQKLAEISNIHDNAATVIALEEEVKKLGKQKAMLTHQFDKMKDKQKSDSRTLDATRRKFRAEVLFEADVFCSTLSGAAYEYLEACDFDLIIIDEAAQAIELSSLIPLKFRCSRCVMVGDPQQLPPTVKSQEASRYGYNQSLFVRLQERNPNAVHLLSIQYRMHPDISQLPSRLFYQQRLQDGPDMASKTLRPWHSHAKLGTYRFFNVAAGREDSGSARGHSYINRAECQVAVALFNRLRLDFSTFDFDFKVGIISMYRGQIVELRRTFEQRFGADISAIVDFNTVDGFQGQEKDVIILSCVRAGPGVQSVGFLKDVRRMNVALTRAKSSLFVLGHAPTLERSDNTWRNIVEDAKARSCFMDVSAIKYSWNPLTFSRKVDVAFFTSPSVMTKSLPAKSAKPKSKINLPPTPINLATPRELKALANATSSSVGAGSAREAHSVETTNASSRATSSTLPSSPGDSKIPQKRSVLDSEQNEGPAPPPPRPQENNEIPPKPRPRRPVKRPKQPPSLFIPKKRPAPDGGESGPSGSRRRI